MINRIAQHLMNRQSLTGMIAIFVQRIDIPLKRIARTEVKFAVGHVTYVNPAKDCLIRVGKHNGPRVIARSVTLVWTPDKFISNQMEMQIPAVGA